jgi:nucleotide-binding universal stress UspA family protein
MTSELSELKVTRSHHPERIDAEPRQYSAAGPMEPNAPLSVREILVPTDFSESSDAALSYAICFARKFGAAVTLLHVLDAAVPHADGDQSASPSPDQLGLAAARHLKALSEKDILRRQVIRQSLVKQGVPHEAITATARDRKADMIILGTRDPACHAHALPGGTAEKVIRHAPCPVLAVPPPRGQLD